MKKTLIVNNQTFITDTIELINPEFNFDQMIRFTLTEPYLNFVTVDLKKRNPNMSIEKVSEIVFNSNILDDSIMIHEYNKYAQ